ncbi:MAG: hypothetical protein MI749_09730 [Desulfovibrionales bacterium]|nr:hypothetical protein [Desulfovibrionales bacterium]
MSIEMGLHKVASAAAEQAQKQQQQDATKPADKDSVNKFKAAMADKTEQAEQAQNVQQGQEAQDPNKVLFQSEVDRARNSDKVMNTLDKMSSEYKQLNMAVEKNSKNAGELGEIIRLQLKVAQVTTAQTMLGKAGEKSSQGVSQLVRGQ